METIAVLLVFFIIFSLVLIFYLGFQKGQIAQAKGELSEKQAIQLAQEIGSLPELECTGAGIELGVDCYDIYKIKAMSEVIQDDQNLRLGIYQEKFGASVITFTELYKMGAPSNQSWTIYSKAPAEKTNQYSFQTLVSLNDPTIDAPIGVKSVGLLEIITYS